MDKNSADMQILLQFVRAAVELAMENKFYRSKLGEVAHVKQNPDFVALERQFQPLLLRLEAAARQESEAQQIPEVLQEILAKLDTLSRSR